MAEVPIRQISDYLWEIPKQGGMRVPGRVYATRELMADIRKDAALEQVANVAHLPGIVGYSLAMPDIHWGYGFPIGGVAAVDAEEGVISPGGVGYDINCLWSEAKVLHHFGYHCRIADLVGNNLDDSVRCYDLQTVRAQSADIAAGLCQRPSHPVLEVITMTGRSTVATSDHPFLTPAGMRNLGELRPGDRVAVDPFEGVLYEEPGDEILVSEEDVRRFLRERGKVNGNAIPQILRSLRDRGLLPLRRNSPALPVLIKTLGFVMGDGTLYFMNDTGKGFTWFFGKAEDLEEIKQDLVPFFQVSSVYSRHRQYQIETDYGAVQFEATNCAVRVTSSAFAVLLALLGCPVGNKSLQDYEVPSWLFTAPLWHKRLFLASYFGAELQTPRAYTERNHNFPCPLLTVQKQEDHVASGRRFLMQIAELVKEFGVETKGIEARRESVARKSGFSCRLRLPFSSRPESLLALYTRIGFEYNRERRVEASVVAAYQAYKRAAWAERTALMMEIVRLRALLGLSASRIAARLAGRPVNLRFVERTIYGKGERTVRTPTGFLSYQEFRNRVTEGLNESGLVWEEVREIRSRADIDQVYDITVNHPDHNFVADGFVVHNCGVRLAVTNLQASEIQDKLSTLADALFATIPCGVGAEGAIPKLSKAEEKKLASQGAEWAIARGFGHPGDIDHIEENGCLAGADPNILSEEALSRGLTQVGTLGSGNHFLEIDRIEEIYEPKVAAALGLSLGQVAMIIHSGSRGLGHQTCEDALKVIGKAMEKYHISVPDRQLACAPISSPEGQRYLAGMACAANYAWVNRQVMMGLAEHAFLAALHVSPRDLGMRLIYDVCHNIAKPETHEIDGVKRKVWVHRKGATRAFGPGHPAIPAVLRPLGQPVLIPGDMGRYSFLLIGTEQAMRETFGSTCHGAGRVMSRAQAKKAARGRNLDQELSEGGVIARYRGRGTFAEEMPYAYKDVADVVEVVDRAGISKKVVKLKPMAVIKG
ncbi:MAG TPA: intein-containing RctB family protein [Candidatus Binatia bacterium]|nr:intein-containing RctB family protein [Candidatus Binatia bacterium]